MFWTIHIIDGRMADRHPNGRFPTLAEAVAHLAVLPICRDAIDITVRSHGDDGTMDTVLIDPATLQPAQETA